MADDDMIRGGDALREIAGWEIPSTAIAALPAVVPGVKPTDAQVASACMSYRHDFGLMDVEQRERLMFTAREWLHAWQKEIAALDPQPVTLADALAVPEVKTLVKAAANMRDHLDRWQDTGAIATAEESKALYDGINNALVALRADVKHG